MTILYRTQFVKGIRTCPVCYITHQWHCSVSNDSSIAICSNVPSNKLAKDGRYIHRLKLGSYESGAATKASALPHSPYGECGNAVTSPLNSRAEAKHLDEIYRVFLAHTWLSPLHGDNLLKRGLSDTAIAANLYASVPDEAEANRKVRAMEKRGYSFVGIPGFYKKNGQWRLNTYYKGFYIPYQNHSGRIVGLQIRLDDESAGKYRWLSSANLSEGTPQSTPLHFAAPDLVEPSSEIIITEGALKADIISQYAHRAIVAIAGVTAVRPKELGMLLRQVFNLRLKRVVLAFDIDWTRNANVKTALLNMKRALEASGLTVCVKTWNENLGKGLDDALVSVERLAA